MNKSNLLGLCWTDRYEFLFESWLMGLLLLIGLFIWVCFHSPYRHLCMSVSAMH